MVNRLVRAWLPLHLIALLALLLQPATPATILGRYSTTSGTLLVVFVVLLPLVWWGTRRLPALVPSLTLPGWLRLLGVAVMGVGLWGLWAMPGASATSYLVLRLYLTMVALSVAVWALDGVNASAWTIWTYPLVGLGVLALLVWLAPRFPGLLWVDEGYMLGVAKGFSETGRLVSAPYAYLNLESFSLMYAGLAGWSGVFGYAFGTARLFVFAVGLVSLGVVYITARRAYDTSAAWVAVVLGGFSLLALNFLRQDVSVAVYLGAALLVFTYATDRPWLHLLVGLLVGVSLDGHPNAYRFGMAFAAAYAFEYGLRMWQAKRLVVYTPFFYLAAGGILGAGLYIFLYSSVLATSLLQTASEAGGGLLNLTDPHLVLLDQFVRGVREIPLLFGASVIAIPVALRQNTPLDRLLVFLFVVPLLVIALLYGYYRGYYLLHSLPVFMLLAASLFHALTVNTSHAVPMGLTLLIVACLLGRTWLQWTQRDAQSYAPALTIATEMRAYVPQDATFVGIDPFYFEMADYPTFVDLVVGGWAANRENRPESDIWQEIDPDAVAVVYDYPLPPSDALLAHVDGWPLVACWDAPRIGRVDLFIQDGMPMTGACGKVG